MKKFMFIFLLVIPFCKAADVNASWNRAFQSLPDWEREEPTVLRLQHQKIETIPGDLDLPNLDILNLCNNQIEAIPANLPPTLMNLILDHNEIKAIPANLEHFNLISLSLNFNHIDHVNPARLLQQFPNLLFLDLNGNPLTPNNVQQIRDAATAAGRTIKIKADDIGDQYRSDFYIKGEEGTS